MLKVGKDSPLHKITYIKHEIIGDEVMTKFSIADAVTDKNGKPIHYTGKDEKQHALVAYYTVTVFENIPLTEKDCIRLLYINDLAQCDVPVEYIDKRGMKRTTTRRCYSISAKIERIEGK
jgi:hypothetical protein